SMSFSSPTTASRWHRSRSMRPDIPVRPHIAWLDLSSRRRGLITMATGALTGRRGTALGAGTALAAASYLISSLAPVTSWIRPARYASLFYWSVGNSQLSQGVSAGDYAVLVAVGLCALTGAMLAFRRLDIH
ncbi:MAG: hypothetical protein ACRDNO_27550, partial [Trebonia sp.]